MNSRDRFSLSMQHQEPDRLPIDLGGTIVSSITVSAFLDLKKHLGQSVEEGIKIMNLPGQVVYPDELFLQRFSIDFRNVQLGASTKPDTKVLDEGNHYICFDRWGSKLQMAKDKGLYFDWVDFPIKEPSLRDIETYNWPLTDPKEDLLQLRNQIQYLYENTDYVLVGSAIIGDGILNEPSHIMGMEKFMVLLASDLKLADLIMEKITDIYIESCNNYLEMVGDYIQVFSYWDDICTQNGWIISPNLYRKVIKPKTRRLVEAIRKKTKAKLFYHSDGAAYNLIPEVIDLGFDIFNPIQLTAKGMDIKRLKRDFGNDIVFWGGGIDTQYTLPFGTCRDVVDEVKRNIECLAPGGGFVFAADHNIQAFVPSENIAAAFDTALEFGRY